MANTKPAPARGAQKPTRAESAAALEAERVERKADTNADPENTHPFRDPGTHKVGTRGTVATTH